MTHRFLSHGLGEVTGGWSETVVCSMSIRHLSFQLQESDTTERLSIKCVGHFIDVIESSSQSYKISIYPCFTNRRAETQRLLARGHRAAGGVSVLPFTSCVIWGKLFYLCGLVYSL